MSAAKNSQACAARLRIVLVLAILLVTTSGCLVGPDYRRPRTPVPDAWHQKLQDGTSYLDAEGVRQWWTLLGDPTLDSLILRAKENNLDLNAALQRIYQARQFVNIARSARLPFVDGTSSFRNSKQAAAVLPFLDPSIDLPAIDVWSVGFDAAWEPDVWGRVQRDIEANCATYQSFIEAYRDLMVTVYAEVARNYVELRAFQERLQYARQNVEIQKASLELANLRVEGGVSPILDSYQATANLAGTEAEIPPLESAIQQTLNRLAVLIGEYPRALHCELLEAAPIPTVPAELPYVLPCDVVRQRPDIRQAERLLAARTAEIGVSVGDLFPRFTINGTFNFSAQKFSEAFSLSSRAWNYQVGPNVRWAWFQGGLIRANIATAEFAADEALVNYEQTLLLAAEEVENAIVAFNKERDRRAALERSVAAAQDSLKSVLEIYRAGNTDFQNVLVTQNGLFNAQNQLAASEGQVVVNLIAFYKAIGGGWDPVHHCQPRVVRLACPPACPTEIEPPPVEPESYLLDDEDETSDMPLDDADIEGDQSEEPGEQDIDGGDAVEEPVDVPRDPVNELSIPRSRQ